MRSGPVHYLPESGLPPVFICMGDDGGEFTGYFVNFGFFFSRFYFASMLDNIFSFIKLQLVEACLALYYEISPTCIKSKTLF